MKGKGGDDGNIDDVYRVFLNFIDHIFNIAGNEFSAIKDKAKEHYTKFFKI